MVSGVYRITVRSTGKQYIGSSVNVARRLQDHRFRVRHGRHYYEELHDLNDLTLEVVLVCRPEDRFAYEQIVIDGLDAALLVNQNRRVHHRKPTHPPHPDDYKMIARENRRLGILKRNAEDRKNGIIRRHKPESIEKIRQLKLGKTYGPETRAKLSKVWLGKKRTAANCKLLGETQKAARTAEAYLYGPRVQTPESNEKRRLALIGRPRDEATKAKIKTALTGRKRPPEVVEKMRQNWRNKHSVAYPVAILPRDHPLWGKDEDEKL